MNSVAWAVDVVIPLRRKLVFDNRNMQAIELGVSDLDRRARTKSVTQGVCSLAHVLLVLSPSACYAG